MTVFLGSATLRGNTVEMDAPMGFGSLNGVRITNYTGDVLVLQGISGENASTEYLMPLQQMIYKTENVSRVPTIRGLVLGNAIATPAVFVEWSDDMLADFIGTYPAAIVQVALLQPDVSFSHIVLRHFPVANTTVTVAAAQRHSITVINAGTTNIKWNDRDDFTDQPVIAPGSGRTLETTHALYFQSDAAGGLLEVFQD